jgi:hypothetical protein
MPIPRENDNITLYIQANRKAWLNTLYTEAFLVYTYLRGV